MSNIKPRHLIQIILISAPISSNRDKGCNAMHAYKWIRPIKISETSEYTCIGLSYLSGIYLYQLMCSTTTHKKFFPLLKCPCVWIWHFTSWWNPDSHPGSLSALPVPVCLPYCHFIYLFQQNAHSLLWGGPVGQQEVRKTLFKNLLPSRPRITYESPWKYAISFDGLGPRRSKAAKKGKQHSTLNTLLPLVSTPSSPQTTPCPLLCRFTSPGKKI